ncbi:EEF1A lysine methyltransferase 3-like [Leucoraja erinacea]|uniref:EEF1A lysine methyltransferase 3-like n=1 Tax=Leucoraja erinaceus TaxID=7782 RepID=UPI00245563A0|nr:EEF1A lysine methyltransferase 3-like [Leucoraja erinacea]
MSGTAQTGQPEPAGGDTESERPADHSGSGPLNSQSKELFPDQDRRFEFCGHVLKITQQLSKFAIPAIVWQSGIVLCRYFEEERITFIGQKVIELGSGTGIVGILAILLGGEVTLTDKPEVLGQIERNVARNVSPSMIPRPKVAALSWGEDEDQFPRDYDIILGSDIVYWPRSFLQLLKTLKHLSDRRTVIYLSSIMSEKMGAVEFYATLLPELFHCELVYQTPNLEVNIYRVTRKSSTY